MQQPIRALQSRAESRDRQRPVSGNELWVGRRHLSHVVVPNRLRLRSFVLWTLAALWSVAMVGAVQLTGVLGADAANCRSSDSCAPSNTTTATAIRTRQRVVPTPPTTAKPLPFATLTKSAPTSTAPTIRAVAAPTSCAGIVAGIVWPPTAHVRCAGPRPGLFGLTDRAGTTLFVRADETMTWLRVAALHEAGHAWDVARLNPVRIAQWCATRGCNAVQFFSGGASGPGWHAPGGAEDWAASWDACHGGEYHRSYIGLAAPTASQCALQNTLVRYPG
jgi:hypothetical protein